MATTTKTRRSSKTPNSGATARPAGTPARAPVEIVKGTWVLPCNLLDEWDRPDSAFAPYVKHSVRDGISLTYALIGGLDDTTGEPYASLALSFRPAPAASHKLLLIAIYEALLGKADAEYFGLSFEAYRREKSHKSLSDGAIGIKRTLKTNGPVYSCTVTSEFFTIAFDYDFNRYEIKRFKYSPLPDLKETKTGKQRPHRKRDELPDPDSTADSEINRYDSKFQTRISKDASQRVESFLKASGLKKTEMTERALAEFIDRHAGEFGFDPEA